MFNWIKRHRAFVIIIGVIVLLSLILTFSFLHHGNSFIADKVKQGTTIVSEPLTSAADGIKSSIKAIFGFKSLIRENEELKAQVSKLEKEVTALTLSQKELQELKEISNVLNYESVVDKYKMVTGNVTAMDNSNFFNIFTIDKGVENGIYEGAIVIDGTGLVGRVFDVGKGYSKVSSVVDENNNISFQVLRDSNIMGVVCGDGKGSLTGFTLDENAGIVPGDLLITTGIGLYPEGIEIGRVTSVKLNNDTQLKSVTAKTAVSFKSVRKVVVLI